VRRFYQALLKLRPKIQDRTRCDARAAGDALMLRRWGETELLAAISLGGGATLELPAPRRGSWRLRLDAGDCDGPKGLQVTEHDRSLTVTLPPLGVAVWESAVP
jgi:hypothetical protein